MKLILHGVIAVALFYLFVVINEINLSFKEFSTWAFLALWIIFYWAVLGNIKRWRSKINGK